ncbi:MAG: hypothetical protein V3T60_01045 [Candidatus Binatia bacterium]
MDTVQQHCLLASDKLGQSRYRQAIFQTVKAGDLVLDLGTGTGIHALFSCQAGAGRGFLKRAAPVIPAQMGQTLHVLSAYSGRL